MRNVTIFVRSTFAGANRVSGTFLVLLAFVGLTASAGLPFGSLRAPDAGFFPKTLSVLMLIFGSGILIQSFLKEDARPDLSGRSWLVVIAAASLCIYAVTLEKVGFVVDTVLIMMLMMCGFGRMKVHVSLIFSTLVAVVCYAGFVELGVPLPKGVLPF